MTENRPTHARADRTPRYLEGRPQYLELTEETAEEAGAVWTLRYSLHAAGRLDFSPRADDWLKVGTAQTERVRINGVSYRGSIDYGYRIRTGETAHHLDTFQEWERIDDDGRRMGYGTTDAARARLELIAENLAPAFPAPTAADLRHAVARWSRDAARAAVSSMLEQLNRETAAWAEQAAGFEDTAREAIGAEFRRLLATTPEEQRAAGDWGSGWGRLVQVNNLGAEHAERFPETAEAADLEAWEAAEERRAAQAARTAARHAVTPEQAARTAARLAAMSAEECDTAAAAADQAGRPAAALLWRRRAADKRAATATGTATPATGTASA